MRLRLITWNVRHGLGLDRRVSLERVLGVLEPLEADLIALQELDVGRARTRHVDQPEWLAARLAMRPVFAETCPGYGHALFSRRPRARSELVPLPSGRASEPRALIDAQLEGGPRVMATHFGLIPHERSAQARVVHGLLDASTAPAIVLGDLNGSPGQAGYAELAPPLADALAGHAPRARCTWPAVWPFRALDHVLAGGGVTLERARVVADAAARVASDHRPVFAEAVLTGGTLVASLDRGSGATTSNGGDHACERCRTPTT